MTTHHLETVAPDAVIAYPDDITPQYTPAPLTHSARLILPITDNDGAVQNWDSALETIAEIFGGATTYTGNGLWKNGRLYRDPILIVDIDFDGSAARLQDLGRIAQHVKTQAKQESVYLRIAEARTHFI